MLLAEHPVLRLTTCHKARLLCLHRATSTYTECGSCTSQFGLLAAAQYEPLSGHSFKVNPVSDKATVGTSL
jgi:hypothetical protein